MARKGIPITLAAPTPPTRMRVRRIEMGLTLGELGRRVGVSESHMSLMERDHRRPSLDLAMKIADELSLTVEELYRPSPQEAIT